MIEHQRYFEPYWGNPDKQSAALAHALANRQFEIEFYWKRTTYFWTLNGAALAGYFALATARNPAPPLYSFGVACLGLVIAVASFLVNKGSKYWHENWENHVAVLSEPVAGPVFKYVLHRPDSKLLESLDPARPAAISVTRINQWVGVYLILFWVGLATTSSPFGNLIKASCLGRHSYAAILGLTLLYCIFIRVFSATSHGPHPLQAKRIESTIDN